MWFTLPFPLVSWLFSLFPFANFWLICKLNDTIIYTLHNFMLLLTGYYVVINQKPNWGVDNNIIEYTTSTGNFYPILWRVYKQCIIKPVSSHVVMIWLHFAVCAWPYIYFSVTSIYVLGLRLTTTSDVLNQKSFYLNQKSFYRPHLCSIIIGQLIL